MLNIEGNTDLSRGYNSDFGRPGACGQPGQANSLSVLQTDYSLNFFSASDRVSEPFVGLLPKVPMIFAEIIPRVEARIP